MQSISPHNIKTIHNLSFWLCMNRKFLGYNHFFLVLRSSSFIYGNTEYGTEKKCFTFDHFLIQTLLAILE